jgi:RND family efflux transporter MFP subunit
VRTAHVTLTQAEDRLRDARIVAPASGTAIRRKIEPGEMVIPGVESTFEKRALLMIADLSRLVIKIELNQIDVSKVRLGQRVTATFDGLPDEKFAARVTEISPASTKAKDLDVFPIKAELDQPDPRIKPGMTADVRVHIEEKPAAVTVPIESVTHEAGKAFVKRIIERQKDRHTERVEVVLGTQNDRFAEVVSGLNEGEQVLLDPPAAKAEKAM